MSTFPCITLLSEVTEIVANISLSDLVDADFFLEKPDATLFPGLSSDIEVHNGFAGSHSRSVAEQCFIQSTQIDLLV